MRSFALAGWVALGLMACAAQAATVSGRVVGDEPVVRLSKAQKSAKAPGTNTLTVKVGPEYDKMSAMGRLAYVYRQAAQASSSGKLQVASVGKSTKVRIAAVNGPGPDTCENADEDCGNEGFSEGPSGGQAEMAIAVDATGNNIVIGYNDTRGFSVSPNSLSGVAWSNNGGLTFVDAGQLPNPTNGSLGATALPQVFGDPDIKYVPGGAGCQFIYASIFVVGKPVGGPFTSSAQTMSIHRSTDCGHTWAGPFEVTSATQPVASADAADKEFIDVDPDTGRVLLSWTNFGSTGSTIRTTFSDNIMSATPPTWSASVRVDTSAGAVQGSVPRFAGNGSPNAYVSWYQDTTGTVLTQFVRSTDNGATWSAPITVNAVGGEMDYIVGNDRVHSFPIMAVDTSPGPFSGNVYIVNAVNQGLSGGKDGGADITFNRSTDGGFTFSATTFLTPKPGNDRSQWWPHVAVDSTTGRVHVTYYDQSVSASGDVIDSSWVYSDDGGVTWSPPTSLTAGNCVLGTGATDPLDCRPFHAGYGNDSGQPNLGDYNAATAQNGTLYATWAATQRKMLFTDIQPAGSWPSPDFMFNKATTKQAGLRPGNFSIVDSGGNGFADAGDQIRMTIPLSNFTTNATLSPTLYSGVTGTLSSPTPGVSFQRATVSYPNIAAGATANNTLEYVFTLAPNFVPGTKIELALAVSTAQGPMTRRMSMDTGTPVATAFFSENFEGVVPPALPAGWGTIHQGGANTVAWRSAANATLPCTGSNGLFHPNAEDGVSGNATRFERATSPNIVVPAAAQYVTLEFDICYNTEDDLQYGSDNPVLAYDGAHLRITDFTAGRLAVATWVEAFADDITTGSIKHFPKHAPRSSNTSYFQDISMWAGNSGGVKHVTMRFSGMQGSTIQLRPDYTQDGNGVCAVAPCGVMIDNIVMKSVTLKSDELKSLTLRPVPGSTGAYTATVTSQPIAPAGGITVNLSSSNAGITTMPPSVTIPAGSQTSAPFNVTISPAPAGTNVTITATGPSNARTGAIAIR